MNGTSNMYMYALKHCIDAYMHTTSLSKEAHMHATLNSECTEASHVRMRCDTSSCMLDLLFHGMRQSVRARML